MALHSVHMVALHSVIAVLLWRPNRACTIIAVGKDASASGAPMLGHSEDAGPIPNDVRLVRVPRKTWPKDSVRPLHKVSASYPRIVDETRAPDYAPVNGQVPMVPLGFIPQVPMTYAYWNLDYGLQNEAGVSIVESTCTAMTVGWPADVPYGYNKAGIEELSNIALERCSTARCAVQTMGGIAVEVGFYSADSGDPAAPVYGGSSECLGVGDATGEIWIFNILTGKNNASAIWAAQRMPQDHVIAVANAFSIRKLNLSDPENFLYSPGVTELAEEKGWWTKEEEKSPGTFDFFSAYGYTPGVMGETVTPPNAASVLAYYSGRRMWRIFSWLSPEEGAKLDDNKGNLPKTKDPVPSSVPAKPGSVTLSMVRNLFRDHYEGTKYDLTKGMAAGPHGSPNRVAVASKTTIGQWERAISMYRATWSFINVMHPGGRHLFWFGYDAPHGTAYLPFYGAAPVDAPQSFHTHDGTLAKFSHNMAYMPFMIANSFSESNFQLINADIRKKADEVESTLDLQLPTWEKEKLPTGDLKPSDLSELCGLTNDFAEKVVKEWWELLYTLFIKYGRLQQVFNDTSEDFYGQSYPDWWLRSENVGFAIWRPTGPVHGVPDIPKQDLPSEVVERDATSLPGNLDDGHWRLLPSGLTGAVALIAAYVAGMATGRQLEQNQRRPRYFSLDQSQTSSC